MVIYTLTYLLVYISIWTPLWWYSQSYDSVISIGGVWTLRAEDRLCYYGSSMYMVTLPGRYTIVCEVSGKCDSRRIQNWLIMNYTKMNRIVINNNKISYAISLSR